MEIDSYEKFYKAFKGDEPERWTADILLFLQDWAVTAIAWAENENGDYGLDRFLEQVSNRLNSPARPKDAISRLMDNTEVAVRRISENMRSTIVRENVQQPVAKVREINSYCLQWLNRRPGRTIKEKIANSNSSMMAVRRRQSLDTGENRLFLAFLRQMSVLLDIKLSTLPAERLRQEEQEFASLIFRICKDLEDYDIRRWENLPPNNTLLSDQNYGKIWRFWNEMRMIDEIVSGDFQSLNQRLAMLFFIFFLAKARTSFALPQIPVYLDYNTRDIKLLAPFFCGVDAAGNILDITLNAATLKLRYLQEDFAVSVDGNRLIVSSPRRGKRMLPLLAGSLVKYADMLLGELDCPRHLPMQTPVVTPPSLWRKTVMDLFQIRPNYAPDAEKVRDLDGRILFQRHAWNMEGDDRESIFALPNDRSQSIETTSGIATYSVVSAVEDANPVYLADLARLIGSYIKSRSLVLLFPDLYNEFQIATVHKALRLAFATVESFPRSMGAAFWLLRSPDFGKKFKAGDFLLILDLVYDDISFTLVQSTRDELVAADIPEYDGLIWERHPTEWESPTREIDLLINALLKHGCQDARQIYKLLGVDGIKSEAGKLAIFYNTQKVFQLEANILPANMRVPVTERVQAFLERHKEIIGGAQVHVVSLSSALFYKGRNSFSVASYDDAIRGCQYFATLQNRTHHVLWKDHLPELSIKLLYGKFNLVENQTVRPAFNVEKKITIDRKFLLPKGKKEYRLRLVSNNASRKTQYAAVVRHPAFPLKRDVICRLNMSYRYGAEEPYTLVFIPEDSDSGFAEAKVAWEPAGKYPCENLPSPPVLSPANWDDLKCHKGTNEDLINGSGGIIEFFKLLSEGYTTINLKDHNPVIQTGAKGRYFSIRMQIGGQNIKVSFHENGIETHHKIKHANFDNLGQVSFQLCESENKTKRYLLDLEQGRRGRDIWVQGKKGYYCLRNLTVDGKTITVRFEESNMDPRESFSHDIRLVSFELNQISDEPDRPHYPRNIHDEGRGTYQPEKWYWARLIRDGDKPPNFLYSGKAFFLFHELFRAGNRISEPSVPPNLRFAFENTKEEWLKLYQHIANTDAGVKTFALMSLCAQDIGAPYYNIANGLLDELLADPKYNHRYDYMGYALGDQSSEYQRRLFERILLLGEKKPLSAIRLLAKAVWGHPDFIMNVEKSILLDYFDKACSILTGICTERKFRLRNDITACLEYILAIYRLRNLEDEGINYQLSRNRPEVLDLYRSLEILVKAVVAGELTIRSFLMNIPDKGEYKEVPDLIYVLLVYVTGEAETADIKIIGLNPEDIEA